jgi:putative ABC transport system substrate-binding protein
LTGVNLFNLELNAKRLELLRQLIPAATRVAVLVNSANAVSTSAEVEAAARIMGLRTQVFTASTSREIDGVFETFARERPDALFVSVDSFFTNRRVQLVHLASRYAIPTTYGNRDFAEAGGLMSYASNILDAWRQTGVYTGRILRGAKPADAVVQASKFELVINAQTARMLRLTVPPSLLATADEVIE